MGYDLTVRDSDGSVIQVTTYVKVRESFFDNKKLFIIFLTVSVYCIQEHRFYRNKTAGHFGYIEFWLQFLYGEDGMDVSKVQFLNEKQIDFLINNRKAIIDKSILKELQDNKDCVQVELHSKKVKIYKIVV